MHFAPIGEDLFFFGRVFVDWRFLFTRKDGVIMKQQRDIHTLEIWSAKELIQLGFSRNMAYAILARPDVPTIRIGERVFVHRQLFEDWLKAQASSTKA